MSQNTKNAYVDDLRKVLAACVAHLKFTKKDGTTKEVIATTNNKFIPEKDHPKTGASGADTTVKYYDVEAKGWRSLREDTDFIVLQSWKSLPKKYRN